MNICDQKLLEIFDKTIKIREDNIEVLRQQKSFQKNISMVNEEHLVKKLGVLLHNIPCTIAQFPIKLDILKRIHMLLFSLDNLSKQDFRNRSYKR